MGPRRFPVSLALLFLFLVFVAAHGFGPWMMPRLLFPLLVFGGIALLFRSRFAWRDQDRPYGTRPAPASPNAAPEEILRARFARGELTRDQYREAIVELLKDRYVRDELTLEEYEARVSVLMDVARQPFREPETAPGVA